MHDNTLSQQALLKGLEGGGGIGGGGLGLP